jgi:hypothetical protein
MTPLYAFISGMIMLGSCVAGAFFFRFWRRTRDRLFLIFGLAFAMMGIERAAHVLLFHFAGEDHVAVYGLRLVAFVLIVVAIADKNRAERGSPPGGLLK